MAAAAAQGRSRFPFYVHRAAFQAEAASAVSGDMGAGKLQAPGGLKLIPADGRRASAAKGFQSARALQSDFCPLGNADRRLIPASRQAVFPLGDYPDRGPLLYVQRAAIVCPGQVGPHVIQNDGDVLRFGCHPDRIFLGDAGKAVFSRLRQGIASLRQIVGTGGHLLFVLRKRQPEGNAAVAVLPHFRHHHPGVGAVV